MAEYADVGQALLIIGWYAVIWWLARRDQVHPTWSPAVRVPLSRGWLLWLCGAQGRSDSLHVPNAMAQFTAIIACWLSIVLVFFPVFDELGENALPYLATTPFLTAAIGYAGMYLARILRRSGP